MSTLGGIGVNRGLNRGFGVLMVSAYPEEREMSYEERDGDVARMMMMIHETVN